MVAHASGLFRPIERSSECVLQQAHSRVGNADSDDVCRALMHSSGLTDEQKSAIVAMRGLYLRNLGLLSRRRQELTTLLQVPTLKVPAGHSKENNVVYALLCTLTELVCFT